MFGKSSNDKRGENFIAQLIRVSTNLEVDYNVGYDLRKSDHLRFYLLVEPWNLMDHSGPKQSLFQYRGKIGRNIKWDFKNKVKNTGSL